MTWLAINLHQARSREPRNTPEGLSPRSIRRAVARAAESVGIEGASGHSLRVGAAVSLVRSGAQTLEVQQIGRWEGPTDAYPLRPPRSSRPKRGRPISVREVTGCLPGADRGGFGLSYSRIDAAG